MAVGQAQSTAPEEEVRNAMAQALTAQGGEIVANQPGQLTVDTGSVGAAWLAGPFRSAQKMPMRITVTTTGGPGGTGINVDVTSRGTGGGFSGGLIGVSKQGKGERLWLETALSSVPARVT